MRYEFGGEEKLLSFGPYLDRGLAAARDRRQDTKQLPRKGQDPGLALRLLTLTAVRPREIRGLLGSNSRA